MKRLALVILAGLTIFILVTILGDVGSLAQNTAPQPTNLISSILNLASTGDAQLILEADLDDTDESANPELVFRQDGGKVNAGIGFQEGQNNLLITNHRGKAKILFRENGSICLGVTCE